MMTERVYPRDYDSPPVSGEHAMRPTGTGGGAHHHRLLSQDSMMSKDSYAYNSGPPSGTFVIQVPKDQIYRVPPPENEYKFKRYTKGKQNRSCCRRCFCTTICILLFLAVLISAATGVFYLIFRPEAPGFSVVGVSIRGVNMTAEAAAGRMKPVFKLTVRSRNGNGHMGIYYLSGSRSMVEVFHDGDKLGSGKMPEYYSPAGDERVFEIVLSGGEIVLSDLERKVMVMEEKKGQVPLVIEVEVPVKMRVGKMKTWTLTATVKSTVVVSSLSAKAKVVKEHTRFHLKPW